MFSRSVGLLSTLSMSATFCFVIAMAVIGTVDVVMTHLFKRALTGAFELSSACLAATAFLGLPYTQRLKRHITVDILTSRLPAFFKALSESVGTMFELLFIGFLTWRMGHLTFESITIMERSSGSLAFFVFPFKALAFFGVFSASLEAFRQLFEPLQQYWAAKAKTSGGHND